jgi:RecA-family ATPase
MPHDAKVLPIGIAGETAFSSNLRQARRAKRSRTSKLNGDTGDGINEDGYRPLKFISAHTLHGLMIPEREWAVQDWLPIGCVTGNWGDGGTGKTLLAQQLMTSCATGKPWLGLATMRCRALGLFCEDDEAELHRRQHRINESYGVEFDDLDDLAWTSAVGEDNALVRFDPDGSVSDTPRLAQLLQEAIAFQARLIVIDTAADTFSGNENERSAVRGFVSRLNRVAIDHKCAVLLNLHPSRSGMRPDGDMDGGSTAWSNTVRSRWSLERPKPGEEERPDPNARLLTRRKANYCGVGETLKLTYRSGALEAACRPTGLAAMSQEAEVDELFLRLLAKAETENRPVSDSRNAGNFASKVFSRQPANGSFTRADFDRAMERLFTAKKIHVVSYGRSGDPRRKLAAVTQAEIPLNVPAAVQNGGL